jgi:hypothetical protein
MAAKKPIADKPAIKVEMSLADPAGDQDDGSTVIQITISGSRSGVRNRVARAIGEAVQATCEKLAQPPKHLH